MVDAAAALTALVQARDEATAAHADATVAWCRRITDALGLDIGLTQRVLGCAALHEIGMIALPDDVLRGTQPLTPAQRRAVQLHPIMGADLLAAIPSLASLAPGVRAHHENYDGSGYPGNLRGSEIPLEARILAVADAFHAMISDRPYRASMTQRAAMDRLRAGAGSQWDGGIVGTLLDALSSHRQRAHPIAAPRGA